MWKDNRILQHPEAHQAWLVMGRGVIPALGASPQHPQSWVLGCSMGLTPLLWGLYPKAKALVRAGLGGEGLRREPCMAAVGYLPTPCSDAHRVLES